MKRLCKWVRRYILRKPPRKDPFEGLYRSGTITVNEHRYRLNREMFSDTILESVRDIEERWAKEKENDEDQ